MSLVSETQLPLSLAYPYSGVRVLLLLVSLTLVGRLDERDREAVRDCACTPQRGKYEPGGR